MGGPTLRFQIFWAQPAQQSIPQLNDPSGLDQMANEDDTLLDRVLLVNPGVFWKAGKR